MRRKLFCIFLVLLIAANRFYDFRYFENESLVKLAYYITFALFSFFVIKASCANRSKFFIYQNAGHVSVGYFIKALLAVVTISVFNAYLFKNQSLFVGFMTTAQVYSAYFLYFILKRWRLSHKDFEQFLFILGITFMVVLLIAYITLPNSLFGRFGIEESRGGIRFRLPGYFWTVALYFYSISRYKASKNKKWWCLIGLCLVCTILTFARQYIAYSIILGFLFYYSGISLSRKILFSLLVLIFSFFILPQMKLFNNYVEMTVEQINNNKYAEDDVRLVDYRVFLFAYPRSTQQYLFGCGMGSYGNSKYGKELEIMAKTDHLIQADTGWAGFVFYYGYVGCVLLAILIIRVLNLRCSSQFTYIKYILVYMSLCAFFGGTILYFNEFMIIIICIYMLDRISSDKILKRNVIKN